MLARGLRGRARRSDRRGRVEPARPGEADLAEAAEVEDLGRGEELVEALREMEDVQLIRPPGTGWKKGWRISLPVTRLLNTASYFSIEACCSLRVLIWL